MPRGCPRMTATPGRDTNRGSASGRATGSRSGESRRRVLPGEANRGRPGSGPSEGRAGPPAGRGRDRCLRVAPSGQDMHVSAVAALAVRHGGLGVAVGLQPRPGRLLEGVQDRLDRRVGGLDFRCPGDHARRIHQLKRQRVRHRRHPAGIAPKCPDAPARLSGRVPHPGGSRPAESLALWLRREVARRAAAAPRRIPEPFHRLVSDAWGCGPAGASLAGEEQRVE